MARKTAWSALGRGAWPSGHRSILGGGPFGHPKDITIFGCVAPVERAPVHRVAVLQGGRLDPLVVLRVPVDER